MTLASIRAAYGVPARPGVEVWVYSGAGEYLGASRITRANGLWLALSVKRRGKRSPERIDVDPRRCVYIGPDGSRLWQPADFAPVSVLTAYGPVRLPPLAPWVAARRAAEAMGQTSGEVVSSGIRYRVRVDAAGKWRAERVP